MKFRDDLPDGNGNTDYVKLKDKESITGIFLGEPLEHYVLWQDGKPKAANKDTKGASFRFKINFVIKTGTSYAPMVFEQGKTVYKQLAEINAEYPLDTIFVKITRNGTGTDTTYSVLPMLKQEISAETMAVLKSITLHELVAKDADGAPF